jgi:hypothetical protein
VHREPERVQRVRRSVCWAAVAGLLAAGCYSYVPLSEPRASSGAEVRVHLTPSGASDLAREIGPRMAAVDGRVLEYSPDSGVTLAVSQLRSTRGDQVAWQGDAPLFIPLSAIESVERRQLARGRTIAASTGATVALAAIGVYAARRGGKGSSTGNPPPPEPP